MVFSSTLFLFTFLPIVLAAYYVLPRPARNGLLLVASLLFYAWGEPSFAGVMLLSVAFNWAMGLAVHGAPGPRAIRLWLALTVVGNLGLLGFFKYANFAVGNVNAVRAWAGLAPWPWTPVALPVGISFFTFQAMSYVLDVHRREAGAERSPLRVALYVALFPQLIAGPIVRYRDVAAQIAWRRETLPQFALGVRRLIVGLGKKVIVANTVAVPADAIFALPAAEVTPALAWLAVASYTVQIYFDFSGYSDMAIGLGHMFGFTFLENFEYPYASRSVKEFWRRWHISLSTWFRDYLYIPLGGNRGSTVRTYGNLLLVFFLCGLWHGASWSFVLWGLYHGAFLVLERTRAGRLVSGLPPPLAHGYVMVQVMVGWVLFRAPDLPAAGRMLAAMLGRTAARPELQPLQLHLTPDVALALLAGVVGSAPALPWLAARLERWQARQPAAWRRGVTGALELTGLAATFLVTAVLLAAQSHNPFIYYRF